MKKKTVVVLIPSYNGEQVLGPCLDAVLAAHSASATISVYVVDNNSTDHSVDIILGYGSRVRLIQSRVNLGFAGGHNLGWRVVQEEVPDCDYLYLLNQDAVVEKDFLDPLVATCESDAAIAAAQSLVCLSGDQADRVNSLGNVIHFLGFGYSSYCGVPRSAAPLKKGEVNYASGAAVLLRTSALREIGLFDEEMFMYLEDLDLGWRIMATGRKSVVVPESVVYHGYEFERSMKQYYYFERNRWWILLKNYRLATLVILAPALVVMELGQLLFATVRGTLGRKLTSYAYFFSIKQLRRLMGERRSFQKLRRVTDGALLSRFSGSIAFQPLSTALLNRIVNPLLSLYLRAARMIILW